MFDELFRKRGLSLDRLRVLCEVAEAGGIARAVGSDTTRQSQFSRQLKELEDYFEVELTRRQGKGMVLTASGLRLAQAVRESFLGLDEFRRECSGEPLVFSIGAGDSLLQWLILPRLGLLKPEFPSIGYEVQNLRTSDIVERLRDLRLDFGLIRQDAVPEQFGSFPLGKLEFCLFAPKSLVPSGKAEDWKWVIANVPLALRAGSNVTPNGAADNQTKMTSPMKGHVICESYPQAYSAMLSGHYAAILPTLAVVDLPRNAYVQIRVPHLKKSVRDICLVWNPRIIRLRDAAGRLAQGLREKLGFGA